MAIQFLPILIGALTTGAGIAINQREIRRAQKRANRENELLRRNKKKFEDEAQENLQKTTKKFGSETREILRQESIAENESLLGEVLGRDGESPLTENPTGKVSSEFINRRADVTQSLVERAKRRAGLLARVTGPGQANFVERQGIIRGQQTGNIISNFQRGQLNVDLLKVNEAGRVRPNFLGDLLTAVGPAIALGGATGAFTGAGAGAGSAGVASAGFAGPTATQLAIAVSEGIPLAGATGLSGIQGLPLGTILANSGGPRRRF